VQPIAPQITHDTWPTIVDTPLMVISIMGQGGYCDLFCLKRQPKIPLLQTTAYQRCDFPRCMTRNWWCFIDAHFHDRARRVLLSVLPIKAAKNSFMTDYNLSEVWFPKTHDHKSWTLRWRSLSSWGREGIAICFAYKGSQKFLCD